MSAMTANEWGARIERGIIDKASGTQYKVKSLDRDGIISPWIEVLSIDPKIRTSVTHDKYESTVSETLTANYKPSEYTVGDMVYFFLFNDGHGAILGKAK